MKVYYMKYVEEDNPNEKTLKDFLPPQQVIEYHNQFSWLPNTSRIYEILYRASIASKFYLNLALGEKNIHIYQTRPIWAVKMTKTINILMPHGALLKRTPGKLEEANPNSNKARLELIKHTNYVISYSDFEAPRLMRIEQSIFDELPKPIVIGHPRNDYLVANKHNYNLINSIKEKYKIPPDNKVILFAPTHRDGHLTNDQILKNYEALLLELFLEKLLKINQALAERKITVIMRPHIMSPTITSRYEGLSNIKIIGQDTAKDPRPFMLIADILITDYSSIYIDWLLLDKPVAFYQPDLTLYVEQIRGLEVDPNDPIQTPGPRLKDLADLLDLNDDCFKAYNLQLSKQLFHKYHDDKATERLAQFIMSLE